jgi:hypothetical protein
MKPKVLKELEQLNRQLKESSWDVYQQFLRTLLSSIDSRESKDCLSLLNKGDFQSLLEYAEHLATAEYESPALHRLNVQIASVVRKYPFPEGLLKNDPRAKALETFMKSEHKCKRINQRFRAYRMVRSPNESLLSLARSYISYVLGDLSISSVWDDCRFGAGASLGVHGSATNLARKLLSESWSVSTGAYSYACAYMKTDVHVFELLTRREDSPFFSVDVQAFNNAFSQRARITDYNNIAFVPKTATVLRTIAVEPFLNGVIQKGIDSIMRKRLKRVGISLSDQETNQRIAREGSLNHLSPDAWATIDLSSASDSISIELCRFLLPPEWFELLNATRSHSYKLDGKVYPYHKFTSMGNGFCFPLETLIFASLCAATLSSQGLKQEFHVYGDDILIRRSAFGPLNRLLKVCGFSVNPKKTFNEGPFRESCGADWFEGEDVRPIILDYAFDSLENIFKFCNISRSKDIWKDIFCEANDFLISLIPRRLKFVRPYPGNADSALEVPWDVFMNSPFARWNRKLFCWSWVELMHLPRADSLVRRLTGYDIALIKGALLGVKSSCPFTERFTSRTKICRITFCGASSTSLYVGVVPLKIWQIAGSD